jgi:hypothetical protein
VTSSLAEKLWFNAVWFQAIWFCTVLGRDSLLTLAALLLALHLWLARADWLGEVRQLLLVGGLGISADALLSAAGVFQFSGGVLVPLWLCCLWLAFAAALRRSLGWLGVRPWLASAAGAIAFPLNYWVGQRAGAVEFGYSLPVTVAVLAVTWAILLPLMYRLGESRAVVQGRRFS